MTMEYKEYTLEQLCPSVKEVGVQGTDSWRQRTRRIFDHELLYCFGKPANLRLEGKLYQLKQGDLAILKPNVPHSFWMDDNKPADVLWVHFDLEHRSDADWLVKFYNTTELYAQLFNSTPLQGRHLRPHAVIEGKHLPDVVHFQQTDEAERLLRTLYRAYARKDPLFALTARALMLNLLVMVLQEDPELNGDKRDDWVTSMLRQYINTHYFQKVTMQDLAASVHMNADYCGRIFREHTGKTLMEYLSQVRIDRAKQLLLEEDLTIAEVGEMVGYKRSNHFNTVCKKVTGKTPMALRRYMITLSRPEGLFKGGDDHVSS